MLQRSLRIIPLRLTHMAQLPNQILGKLTHTLWIIPHIWPDRRHFHLKRPDIVWILRLCDIQRMVAHEHPVKNDAGWVYVNFLAVAFALNLLRRHVKNRSDLLLVRGHANFHFGWKAEIYNFDGIVLALSTGRQLDIVRFQITVNVIAFVNVI